MADNISVTAGVGTAIAADDVSSVFYQKIKVDGGGDGATTPILAGGGVEASALRVTIASDSTGVLSVDDNGGALTVDGTVAVTGMTACNTGAVVLAAGTDLAGKFGIDQATANANEVVVKSGTVTAVTSITNAVAVTNADITTVAGAVSGGHMQVDVLSAPSTAVTNADITTIAGAVSGGHMQVDVLSAPSTAVTNTGTFAVQAACTSGTASNMKVEATIAATQTLSTVTTVATLTNQTQMGGQNISMGTGIRDAGTQRVTIATNDVVPVTFTGSTDAATQTTLAAINTKLTTGTVIGDVNLGATDNAVLDSIVTNTNRVAITGYFQAKLDHADVTTAQVLIAAVADKKFYITSLIFSAAAAGAYWIEDDDAAQITCKWTLAANGGVSWSCPIDTPFKSTTANKGLKVKGSASGVIGCMITGYQLA
jgi:hypothetical protein